MVRLDRFGVAAGVSALVLGLAVPAVAWAQKNSGPLLPPDTPTYRPAPSYAAPPYSAPPYSPAPPRPVPQAAGPGGTNPDAARLAQTLPLDPQTAGLQNQEPPDPRGVERRLGIREPRGPATDMRGRTPSPRDIVNALAPR